LEARRLIASKRLPSGCLRSSALWVVKRKKNGCHMTILKGEPVEGYPSSSVSLCRIAGLNQNNTAKPDKLIKSTVKQKCFSKLFYGKHN
jgi:hypothetical protein